MKNTTNKSQPNHRDKEMLASMNTKCITNKIKIQMNNIFFNFKTLGLKNILHHFEQRV